jgi:hypothetical protein
MNRFLLAIAVIAAPLPTLYAGRANAERPPVVRTVQSKAKDSAAKSKAPSGTYAWNGHKYMAYRNELTWLEANRACKEMGGHLVIIETAEEQNELMKMLRLNGLAKASFWIGATDEAREGTWKWVDGSDATFTNWAPRQPDNGGKKRNQHYVELIAGNDGRWNDLTREETRWYICEWDE